MNDRTMIPNLLSELYGDSLGAQTFQRLEDIMTTYREGVVALKPGVLREQGFSQRDAILITYADQFGKPGLPTLVDFCQFDVAGVLNGIHLLPFYPSSSDDGFSVIDYRQVDPEYGSWEDIARLGETFRLMFDAVINHISVQSEWFQGFLRDDPRYRDYFIVVEGNPDLSDVVRPRSLPLLTNFDTPSGPKKVWTTFSSDQVDLNYKNPDVLLEIIDLLLFYITRGAEFIRLDAIAYLWKEIGTSCIHLPQTHAIIRLFRAILDEIAPHVMLITETNVPHEDNIAYFGNGLDEAQLVYNFALPPLVLHTFMSADASQLSAWARGLRLPSGKTSYFNFLASHDGIGLNPARGILTDAQIDSLVEITESHAGYISYKSNSDGTQSSYELNINFFDALSDPNGVEPPELQVNRFIASQAIMLALVGVPGVYVHSLFGSQSWREGVSLTGQKRAINREKFDRIDLEAELSDSSSQRIRVFSGYKALLRARSSLLAFHPHGEQRILDRGSGIFAVLRLPPGKGHEVLCLHNITPQPQTIRLNSKEWASDKPSVIFDVITDRMLRPGGGEMLVMEPYQVLWVTAGV